MPRSKFFVVKEEFEAMINEIKSLESAEILVEKEYFNERDRWIIVGCSLRHLLSKIKCDTNSPLFVGDECSHGFAIMDDKYRVCVRSLLQVHVKVFNISKGMDSLDHAIKHGVVESSLLSVTNYEAPASGGFYMWKAAVPPWNKDRLASYYGAIVNLWVPEDAKRVSSIGDKIRVSKAIVSNIYYIDKELSVIDADTAQSFYDSRFLYEKFNTVKPELKFDDDQLISCSSGIHGYRTMKRAIIELANHVFDKAGANYSAYFSYITSNLGNTLMSKVEADITMRWRPYQGE